MSTNDRPERDGMPGMRHATSGQDAPPEDGCEAAIRIVRDFLGALEARDIARAQAHLAADVRIVVPGGREVRAVADIVANSSRRYRHIGKHIECVEAFDAPAGSTVVYCRGTLHGAWSDGTSFDGIRFIDRFELRGGRIVLQEVWNDAAERRAALAPR